MMATNFGEKQGLTQSFKSQIGYGTAPVSASNKKKTHQYVKLINRKLTRTDTLQGIALKYGVAVQDLKRENRLYTNDSVFLREMLLIPLTVDNKNVLDDNDQIVNVDRSTGKIVSTVTETNSPCSDTEFATPKTDNFVEAAVLTLDDECNTSDAGQRGSDLRNHQFSSSSSSVLATHSSSSLNKLSNHKNPNASGDFQSISNGDPLMNLRRNSEKDSSTSTAGLTCSRPSSSSSDKSSTTSASDFFSKYDKNIAFLKEEVARMESNSTGLDDLVETNPLSLPEFRKGSRASTSTRVSYQLSEEDSSEGDPVLLIRSRTNSRQVKSTLDRSRQASDELFEL